MIGAWLAGCGAPPGPYVRRVEVRVGADGVDEVRDGPSAAWFTRDSVGDVVLEQRGPSATRYRWDAAHRLVELAAPPLRLTVAYGPDEVRLDRDVDGDGAADVTQRWRYAGGALASVEWSAGVAHVYSRPSADRVRVVEERGGLRMATWDCRYDAAGWRVEMRADVDADGRVDATTTWTRDARGWPVRERSDRGVERTWTYDADGWLVTWESRRDGALEERADYAWVRPPGAAPVRVPAAGFSPTWEPFAGECPEALSELAAR